MKKILITFSFLLFSIFLFAEAFYIKHFDVKIEVSNDGYFDVVETLDVFFTEKRRGIIRAIPRKVNLNGKKYSIQIKDIEVENWKMKAYREGSLQMIRIGDKNKYLDGDQNYIIRYRVYDAFHFLENHTEFKWNITGNEWDVPIDKVTYSVSFSGNIDFSENDYLIVGGKKDEKYNNAIVNFDGQYLKGETTERLQPKEGISLFAKLPKDYITESVRTRSTQEESSEGINDPFFALPLTLIGGFLAWWWNKGKRQKIELDESFEYYPPEDLNPSEVSAFFDRRPDTEDLVALLPMWANLGYVRIQGGKEDDGGLRFEKIQDLPADAYDYEHTVFNALFENNEIIFLPDLKEKLYSSMYKAKTQLAKNIKKRHYLFDENAVNLFHSGKMIVLGLMLLATGILTIVLTKGAALITGIIFLISSVIPIVLHFITPKMSDSGEKMYRHIHRFKNFLKSDSPENVDKLLEKDPTYFERMYPYAVAFGLDEIYAQKFEHNLHHAPSWFLYHGYGNQANEAPLSAFSDFTSQFKPAEIKQVFNSAPASSSSSGGGFSGGGSSGGGFGGGGGSSW